MKRASVVVGMVAVLCVAGAAVAGDWPQFMGPSRNGIASGEKLARTWPEGGPKVLWTVPMGAGFGGPAIQGGKVYVLDRIPTGKDVLRCLDLTTGKEDWTFEYDAPGRLDHEGSRSTPAVDDKYVFTIGSFGDMCCVDKATHKPVWRKNLVKDFDSKADGWGVSQSPLLYKDMVIVAPLGKEIGVAALERATGKVVWTSPALGAMRYMSPTVTTVGGVEQIVMASMSQTGGVDAATGKLLWKYGGYKCNIPITSPTPIGDGRFFITGGYNAGSVMIKVERAGDAFTVKELFRLKDLGSIIHMPLLYDGHLYAEFNTKEKRDGLVCIDLDGNVKWQTKGAPNFDWGGLVLADGLILIVDGKTGILRLVEPNPKEYKELAQAKILGGNNIWGPVALSGGKLVLRDQKQMRCVVVGAGE